LLVRVQPGELLQAFGGRMLAEIPRATAGPASCDAMWHRRMKRVEKAGLTTAEIPALS